MQRNDLDAINLVRLSHNFRRFFKSSNLLLKTVTLKILFQALLKRMKYKEYIITRIQHSLWFLGFYVTVCIYSTTSLVYNDLAILKTKDFFDSLSTTSGQLVLGFIVMLTFYLHIALWERLKSGDGMLALRFFALFILLCVCHFSR